jgi:hypothetical protein
MEVIKHWGPTDQVRWNTAPKKVTVLLVGGESLVLFGCFRESVTLEVVA